MNSEHGIDVDELIKEHNDTLDKLNIVALLHNHKIVQINELEEKIKNLQCCGNCVHCFDCAQMREQDLLPYNSCEHWQWDNMTAEERIKG